MTTALAWIAAVGLLVALNLASVSMLQAQGGIVIVAASVRLLP